MPQREEKLTVNASPDDLWAFIRDFASLCSCIPGVERINKVDDKTVELTVKEKIGVVPLTVDLTAQIESEDPPHRLHGVATAEHLSMEIDVALQATATGTEVTAQFDVAGEGPLKPIVDRLFERRATERAAEFAVILEERFGAVSAGDAAADAHSQPVPARDRAGTLREWLHQLWQRLFGSSTLPGS